MSQQDSNSLPSTILVADDDSNARMMLRYILEADGHSVEEASNGQEALTVFQQTHPDLILMDAMMPTMNGFDACSQLRSLPGGERTPVLMITGLEDEKSVDLAFQVGAVDYVNKPIHWAVLRQRVRRILETQQLEKLRDDLTQMIVHDLKNPIAIIQGYAELLKEDTPTEDWRGDAIQQIYQNSVKLLDMTMMILDIGRLEEGKLVLQLSSRPIVEVLQEVKRSFEILAQSREVTVNIADGDASLEANLDWGLIQRVLANLVQNAIKHSPAKTTVTISYSLQCASGAQGEKTVYISVKDQGEGISPQDQPYVFEKFAQGRDRRRGNRTDTGLGLTFCKLATEAHGGKIQLESAVGVGSTFTLVLPIPKSGIAQNPMGK